MEVKVEVKMDNTFGNNMHLSSLTPSLTSPLTPFLIVYRINRTHLIIISLQKFSVKSRISNYYSYLCNHKHAQL